MEQNENYHHAFGLYSYKNQKLIEYCNRGSKHIKKSGWGCIIFIFSEGKTYERAF